MSSKIYKKESSNLLIITSNYSLIIGNAITKLPVRIPQKTFFRLYWFGWNILLAMVEDAVLTKIFISFNWFFPRCSKLVFKFVTFLILLDSYLKDSLNGPWGLLLIWTIFSRCVAFTDVPQNTPKYMSCINETACFPANCVQQMHLDSLPMGMKCIKWSRKALDGFHLLNGANGWDRFVCLVAGIVSANQRFSHHWYWDVPT